MPRPFAGLPMVAIVFIAALVAYLVYQSSGKVAAPAAEATGETADGSYEDDDLF